MLYACDISEMTQWILFMLSTVIDHHRGFMHIKYTWALCQNWVLIMITYAYFVVTVVYFCDIYKCYEFP